MQRGPLLHVQISLRCFTGNCYLLANELPTSGPFASVPKQVLVPIAEEGHRALADHPIDHSGKVESGVKFSFGVGSILPLVLETISFLIIGWIFIFWFVDKVFLKMGHSWPLFLIIVSSNVQLVDKIWPMPGFKLGISGVGSYRSTNWATTSVLFVDKGLTNQKLVVSNPCSIP